MMAYVDEFGNITDTPPDPTAKKKNQSRKHRAWCSKREHEALTAETHGSRRVFQ